MTDVYDKIKTYREKVLEKPKRNGFLLMLPALLTFCYFIVPDITWEKVWMFIQMLVGMLLYIFSIWAFVLGAYLVFFRNKKKKQ